VALITARQASSVRAARAVLGFVVENLLIGATLEVFGTFVLGGRRRRREPRRRS